MQEQALAWATRGFRVFPLHPETKRPVWKSWTDHATTDPEKIKEIWSKRPYNIGVLTDDMVVVDVDVKNGKDGLLSLLDLDLPETLTVKTPSGGLHLYFSGPSVANSAGTLGDGLDVRSHHGYVIAPGSVFQGGKYELSEDRPVAPFPQSLVETLRKPRERLAPVVVDLDDPSAVVAAKEWLAVHAPAVEGKGGDFHTYKTFCHLRDLGVSEALAVDLAQPWNERCLPPWEPPELRQKAQNAFAYATGAAGGESPQAQFSGVSVPADVPLPARPWFWDGDDAQGSVEWLYPDVLPTTGVAILSAPSGAGKTFVGLYLARSLATGEAWFGVEPNVKGGTLILVGEAFGSLKLRMSSLPGNLPIGATYVGGLAARNAWAQLCSDIRDAAAFMQETHGIAPKMIILDTLSSSGILENEDDNAQAATVMKAFSELSVSLGALLLVIHHPPKSGTGERGAGAIRNNADYVLTINRNGNEPLREIEITKSRDAECRALGTFTLAPVTTKSGSTMVVSPGEVRIKQPREMTKTAQVVEALTLAAVESEIAGWTPQADVQRWFKEKNPMRGAEKAFRDSLRLCLDLGSIEAQAIGGEIFLREKDLEI